MRMENYERDCGYFELSLRQLGESWINQNKFQQVINFQKLGMSDMKSLGYVLPQKWQLLPAGLKSEIQVSESRGLADIVSE